MNLKKLLSVLVLSLSLTLICTAETIAAEDQSGGIIDDSIRDMSIVLGSGTVGAILGLSTLSFVDHPSDHWKNVAIGGAIGIVIGVGTVIFSAASRSSSMSMSQMTVSPMTPDRFATLSRRDFASLRIARDYLKAPSLGLSFPF